MHFGVAIIMDMCNTIITETKQANGDTDMAISGFAYATGYKDRDTATLAMLDMIPEEIGEYENPRVERYEVRHKDTGKKVGRYAIVVDF